MVSQHPKLKSERFVKGVLAKVGYIMKEVAQRCWACWGAARKQKAQEAEGRHPWLQHGLLVDPRLVGRSRQEAREEKKKRR